MSTIILIFIFIFIFFINIFGLQVFKTFFDIDIQYWDICVFIVMSYLVYVYFQIFEINN